MCNRCVKVEGFCETSRKSYFAVNTNLNAENISENNERFWSCEFPQPDFCAKERCVCDLEASLAIFEFFGENSDSWSGVSDRDCQAADSVYRNVEKLVQKSRCCKLKDEGWVKYDEEVQTCDFDRERLMERKSSDKGVSGRGKQSKGNKKKTRRVKTSKSEPGKSNVNKSKSVTGTKKTRGTSDQARDSETEPETQIESPIIPTTVPITEVFDYQTGSFDETTDAADYYEEAYKDVVDGFADWWQKPLFG